jgi:hypothetical protein
VPGLATRQLTGTILVAGISKDQIRIIMNVKMEKLSEIIVSYFIFQHRYFPGEAELCQVKF